MMRPLHLFIQLVVVHLKAVLPLPHCSSLSSNMEGTRGCLIMRPGNYMTIECDGSNAESVKNLLRNFHDHGCSMPLKLQIINPKFLITHDLFNSVRTQLYRLEIRDISLNQSWHGSFRHLHALQALSLHFAENSRSEVRLTSDTFHGLHELQCLRLATKNVAVTMDNNLFKPLQNLQCLTIHGRNIACDCGAVHLFEWLYPRKDSMMNKFRDPVSQRSEQCKIHVLCPDPSHDTIFQHRYPACSQT